MFFFCHILNNTREEILQNDIFDKNKSDLSPQILFKREEFSTLFSRWEGDDFQRIIKIALLFITFLNGRFNYIINHREYIVFMYYPYLTVCSYYVCLLRFLQYRLTYSFPILVCDSTSDFLKTFCQFFEKIYIFLLRFIIGVYFSKISLYIIRGNMKNPM